MMSKKQWFVLFTLFVLYLLLGAAFFYEVQTRDEAATRAVEKEERREIEELLHKHYIPSVEDTQDAIFEKLTTYCGKPMHTNMTESEDPLIWDFYHSLFFVITVLTTVGYGNIAPTTMLGRLVMIFYALIGVPINGILMVNLGEYFGKSFTKLYHRWKSSKMVYDTTRLGLVAQIGLYLIPGFTFFIFIPSVIIMIFEGWDYDVAVYYSFVTLTTIGFGDYVAGVNKPGTDTLSYLIYRIFILFWMIIGLGYGLMVLGFITRGYRSKKMHAFEHALSKNIKKTPKKIRQELRSLVHEFLLMKIKRVYKGEFIYTPTKRERSQSCPDLTIYRNMNSPTMVRKRAQSECVHITELSRIQSDTDLGYLDKEKTFVRRLSEQSNLLIRVANALGTFDSAESSSESDTDGGIDGFSDAEILSSETYNSSWTLPSQKPPIVQPRIMRQRACSEVKFPFAERDNQTPNLTWYGPSATIKLQEIRERAKHGKARSRTLPVQPSMRPVPSLLTRLKNTFIGPKGDDRRSDIESQDYLPRRQRAQSEAQNRYVRQTRSGRNSMCPERVDTVLEETSIAEFLRALTSISVPEATSVVPHRKLGTASLTPPRHSPTRARRLAIRPNLQSRRSSLMPTTPTFSNSRRFSLRPAVVLDKSDFLAPPPPPPYTPLAEEPSVRRSIRVPGSNRRFSLRPVTLFSNPSPVQRQITKTKEKDELKEILNAKL